MKRRIAAGLLLCVSLLFAAAACAAEENRNGEERRGRYVFLHAAEQARYYLDRESLAKQPHPYLKEELLDVWIKVEAQEENAYTYPPPYTLRNYYLRLTKPQYQLKVVLRAGDTPRSKDAVRYPYREKNWRDAYPESLEEILYRRIVAYWQKRGAA